MIDLLLKNAQIIEENRITTGQIAISKGRIDTIDHDNRYIEATHTIDVKNNFLLPGAIDCHVHFNDPGYTWRENFTCGSQAAAAGGVTTVIDMPMQNKPAVSSAAIVNKKDMILAGRSYVDYAYWGALVHSNLDKLDELYKKGIVAFKCFMCTPGTDYTKLELDEIKKVLLILKKYNAVSGYHCEDDKILSDRLEQISGKFTREKYIESRPLAAELKAINNVIELAQQTGGRIHICHVSHPDAAELVKRAKQNGVRITAETCMHYLLFSNDDLLKKGAIFKCAPPLREKGSAEHLWQYVADGTIDCICSDHSPCAPYEKNEDGVQGIYSAWGGISGVQTSLQILWDLTVNKKGSTPMMVSKLMATNPACIFGLSHRKGMIKEGMDADITIIDPEKMWTIHNNDLYYKNKFSAFAGVSGKGCPIMTIVRGNIIYDNGKFGQRLGERICLRS